MDVAERIVCHFVEFFFEPNKDGGGENLPIFVMPTDKNSKRLKTLRHKQQKAAYNVLAGWSTWHLRGFFLCGIHHFRQVFQSDLTFFRCGSTVELANSMTGL